MGALAAVKVTANSCFTFKTPADLLFHFSNADFIYKSFILVPDTEVEQKGHLRSKQLSLLLLLCCGIAFLSLRHHPLRYPQPLVNSPLFFLSSSG